MYIQWDVKIWGPTVSTYMWCLHAHLVSHILTHSLTTVCLDWNITCGLSLYNNIAFSYDLLIKWLFLKLPKLLFVTVNTKSRADPTGLLATGSTVARLLGLRVRIPPGAWLSVSCRCCECCLLSRSEVSAPGWSLVWWSPTVCGVCDGEASIMRLWPTWGCRGMNKKKLNLENMEKWRKTNEGIFFLFLYRAIVLDLQIIKPTICVKVLF